MATLLTAFVANLRIDLKDTDSTAYLWTDDELERHVAHAVTEYQGARPGHSSVEVTIVADDDGNTRQQTIASLAGDYLWAERVEYPLSQDPPSWRMFREIGDASGIVLLLGGDPPVSGETLKVWYATSQSLTADASTLDAAGEEVVMVGAAAYAALAATRYATGRLNASEWTPKGLAAFGVARLTEFRAELKALREVGGSWGLAVPAWDGPV